MRTVLERFISRPEARTWSPYMPVTVVAAIMAVVLGVNLWFGLNHSLVSSLPAIDARRFERRAPDPATIARFRSRAAAYVQQAEALERRAAGPGAQDVSALKGDADLYRAWARQMEAEAFTGEAVAASRHATQLTWVYSTYLDVLACLMAAGLAWAIIVAVTSDLRRKEKIGRRQVQWVVVASVLAPIAGYVLFIAFWDDYWSNAFSLLYRHVALEFIRTDDAIHVGTALLYVVMSGVVVGAPIYFLPRERSQPDIGEVEDAAREVARRIRQLRLALYVGAAMLVIYVANESAVFHTALSYLDPAQKELGERVDGLIASAVTARSLIAFVLVTVVYVPGALMLQVMGRELAHLALPAALPAEREKWLKDRGLVALSALENAKPAAAILAPLITGPIAEVFRGVLS
ncbi:MAG TPA: hypothetical protein VEX86_00350 [Longimicrobium sp.]|nr:hypothetical protein [Longimicrobium sp.]